jgi:predicted kinase
VPVPRLVLVSGPTGAGKSTLANAIADELSCAVGSFDWLMSALRAIPEVWSVVELPVEHQRRVGWSLLSRLAEEELRAGRDLVLDLVARETARKEWQLLAGRYDARFGVIECTCSDAQLQLRRVDGRTRDIPCWYELSTSAVERSRASYEPLAEPKLVVDAVQPLRHNLAVVLDYLGVARAN